MMEPSPLARYFFILPNTPEERILRLLISVGIEITGADEGSLLVLDEATDELVFAMTAGGTDSERALMGQRVPLGQGITGLAGLSREVQIGAPTFKDIRQSERVESGGGPVAVIAAPMLVDDALIGVITAVSFDPDRRFGSRDAAVYGGFAAIAGLVVQQRRRLDQAAAEGPAQLPTGAEARLVNAVGRLVNGQPGSVDRIASLLEAIDTVVRESRP